MKRSTLYALPIAVGVVVALTLALIQPRAHGSNLAVPEGGIFRISLAAGSGIDYIDPALSFTPAGWALLDTVCARLMAYPDKRPPAGFRARARGGRRAAEGLARPAGRTRSRCAPAFASATAPPFARVRSPRAINRTLAPGDDVAGRPVHARHRRRGRRPGGADADRGGSRGQGEHARRPLHAPGARLPGTDGDAVLLRRAADAAVDAEGVGAFPAPARTTSPSTGRASAS